MSTTYNTFYLTLLAFLMAAKQQLIGVCEPYGLSSMQAVTLLLLDSRQPQPMKNLCGMFHCDASNVTGIVDGLEAKRLVSRRSDPKDRRIKIVCLEPAGRELQQQILHDLALSQRDLVGPLTAQEAEQFMRLLAKIAPSHLSQFA